MRKSAGPTSLNIVARRQNISKINQENDVFIQKLRQVKPSVPSGKDLDRVNESVSVHNGSYFIRS